MGSKTVKLAVFGVWLFLMGVSLHVIGAEQVGFSGMWSGRAGKGDCVVSVSGTTLLIAVKSVAALPATGDWIRAVYVSFDESVGSRLGDWAVLVTDDPHGWMQQDGYRAYVYDEDHNDLQAWNTTDSFSTGVSVEKRATEYVFSVDMSKHASYLGKGGVDPDWGEVCVYTTYEDWGGCYSQQSSDGYKADLCGSWQCVWNSVKSFRRGTTGASVSTAWKKARKLSFVLTQSGQPTELVQLKVGKANAKTGKVKVSGALIGLNGKKVAMKASMGTVSNDKVTVSLVIPGSPNPLVATVSGTGIVAAAKGTEQFSSLGVGGNLSGSIHSVCLPAATYVPSQLDDLLPVGDGEAFAVTGSKWVFPKAAKVKYDKKVGKLTVNTEGGKTNLSGMKVSYKPATGVFKGNFKVYALENGRLSKSKVQMTGIVAGGMGYGVAICKKPAGGPWKISVK